MSEEPMSKDEEKCMKLIYNGGYIPDLAIDVDPHHDMRGWLFYRHPYGQWEPLVYVEEQYDAIKQEVERLVEALKQARGDYENKHDCENDTYEQGYIDGMEQAISIVNDWQTLDGKTKP